MNKLIEQELQDLNEKEVKNVLALVRYLKWRKTGGVKTKEIRRGERLHFAIVRPAAKMIVSH